MRNWHHHTSNSKLLCRSQLIKLEVLKSADNQQLPTAPSWLDGMCRNVMVNGNQSKLLGLGAVMGLGMEENERENVPLISVKTDPRPADTVAAVASSRGSKLTSVRKPEDSCSVSPPPRLGSFYWISERNVYKMTTVLLKTGKEENWKKKKSSHGKWNESVALEVLAASILPNCLA